MPNTTGAMLEKHPGLKLPPLTDEPGEKRTISPDEMFVQILDPATGTATFLVEVIEVIHKHLKTLWKTGGAAAMPTIQNPTFNIQNWSDYWNAYVPKALLPRLHAFELMMAPYAIAHMKLGLKLAETGYKFATEERARIYLTNALEEPDDKQAKLIGFDALAHEAEAVNKIKRHKRFTVIIGNPPYAGHSANASVTNTGELTYIGRLLKNYFEVDGAPLGERNPKWLQDDYVKFVRSAQSWIDATRVGILGFITNHGYLDNPTFRGMREKLVRSFSRIDLLDLHGNSNKRERTPEGGLDENVFDIQQGVAIGIFLKQISSDVPIVTHANLWGERGSKYHMLLNGCGNLDREKLPVDSPTYYFFPQDGALRQEYLRGISLSVAAPVNTVGIVTGQDAETIGFTKLEAKDLAEKHRLQDSCVQRTLYRPMDRRFIVYSKRLVTRPREEVMRHMLAGRNLGLITTRSTKDKWDVHVTDSLCGHKTCSAYDINYLFPLYVYEHSWDFDLRSKATGAKDSLSHRPNLAAGLLKELATTLQLPQKGSNGLPTGLTPEDIFHYAYAVFHSPGYRSRYAEFLKIDFPRLPLTGNLELFRELARLGSELTALHLLESPKLDKPTTDFIGSSKEVTRIGWSDNTVWIDAPAKKKDVTQAPGSSGFKGVPEAVWNFHIGGYQVCQKWLKDRKGRTLTDEDIAHYHKIVISLSETIRLMTEIDEVIETHGGWPGAFAGAPENT
jgi:predicted helicase